MTHLSIKVIIYQGGSSLRHPKGARSIGIGHPRSGDRCTEPRPYTLDPLRVAEQKSSFPSPPPRCRTYQGVRQCVRHPGGVEGSFGMPGPRVFAASPLDPWLNTVHPCRGASFPTLHNELMDFCATQMRHPWTPVPVTPGVTHMSIRVIAYRRGFIREAPEGCSLHRHRSSAKR